MYPDITTCEGNLERVKKSGLNLIDYFSLPEDAWWVEYYEPLQEKVDALRKKYAKDPEALWVIEEDQIEIHMFQKYNAWYGSTFFLMQKPSTG